MEGRREFIDGREDRTEGREDIEKESIKPKMEQSPRYTPEEARLLRLPQLIEIRRTDAGDHQNLIKKLEGSGAQEALDDISKRHEELKRNLQEMEDEFEKRKEHIEALRNQDAAAKRMGKLEGNITRFTEELMKVRDGGNAERVRSLEEERGSNLTDLTRLREIWGEGAGDIREGTAHEKSGLSSRIISGESSPNSKEEAKPADLDSIRATLRRYIEDSPTAVARERFSKMLNAVEEDAKRKKL